MKGIISYKENLNHTQRVHCFWQSSCIQICGDIMPRGTKLSGFEKGRNMAYRREMRTFEGLADEFGRSIGVIKFSMAHPERYYTRKGHKDQELYQVQKSGAWLEKRKRAVLVFQVFKKKFAALCKCSHNLTIFA